MYVSLSSEFKYLDTVLIREIASQTSDYYEAYQILLCMDEDRHNEQQRAHQ